MIREEVIRINLPDGAEYRKVEVTDGSISIFYAIHDATRFLPKPIPLVGGSSVYQKEGTPYWYCKIKNCRDEFMNLFFRDLTIYDLIYDANGEERKFITESQKKFKANVINALQNMPEEGYRWIPVYEPSMDGDGNLQFVSGEKILTNLNSYKWEEIFQNYSPENGSGMLSKTTYFLLLLRLLKDGWVSIEQLADNSKEIGKWKSRQSKYEFLKTGVCQVGGIYGLEGNTYKIVKDSESESGTEYLILGMIISVYGHRLPLADIVFNFHPNSTQEYGVGMMELTK